MIKLILKAMWSKPKEPLGGHLRLPSALSAPLFLAFITGFPPPLPCSVFNLLYSFPFVCLEDCFLIFFSPAKFCNTLAAISLGTSPHLKSGREKAVMLRDNRKCLWRGMLTHGRQFFTLIWQHSGSWDARGSIFSEAKYKVHDNLQYQWEQATPDSTVAILSPLTWK